MLQQRDLFGNTPAFCRHHKTDPIGANIYVANFVYRHTAHVACDAAYWAFVLPLVRCLVKLAGCHIIDSNPLACTDPQITGAVFSDYVDKIMRQRVGVFQDVPKHFEAITIVAV